MIENTIRLLLNREFLVLDLSAITSFYGSFFLDVIIEKSGTTATSLNEMELGDFDLQGKMSYHPTQIEKFKLTYLDEKALLFKSPDVAEHFKSILTPGILFSRKMADTDDDDWFGETLFYGKYEKSPVNLKSGKTEWHSPALLRTLLQDLNDIKNRMVSTGGCMFDELRDKKIIDLSRTPENHLFVEDEENLLLGSGLSPLTARHLLRSQYPALDAVFDAIEEPFSHSSSLWDICCFHPSGKRLINTLVELNTIVTIHNGKESINVSPALLNKFTPGLALYFLISKKSISPIL